MKLGITFVFCIMMMYCWSQQLSDYIITIKGDTVFTKVIKLDRKQKYVICEDSGRQIKYKSENILALQMDTFFYESGLVKLKKRKCKHFVFLKKTVKGKLNVYEMTVKQSKFLWKTFGEDVLHLRWVYRAHNWTKAVYETLYFYKKEQEGRNCFTKDWKEKTKDCKVLNDKLNSKATVRTPTAKEAVVFYNTMCN
ncbi:MAG: hypothetical protein SFY56_10865 [Bacteroidota bacterium]|nr:hypothetical protein [Bacteroidota bacterium]